MNIIVRKNLFDLYSRLCYLLKKLEIPFSLTKYSDSVNYGEVSGLSNEVLNTLKLFKKDPSYIKFGKSSTPVFMIDTKIQKDFFDVLNIELKFNSYYYDINIFRVLDLTNNYTLISLVQDYQEILDSLNLTLRRELVQLIQRIHTRLQELERDYESDLTRLKKEQDNLELSRKINSFICDNSTKLVGVFIKREENKSPEEIIKLVKEEFGYFFNSSPESFYICKDMDLTFYINRIKEFSFNELESKQEIRISKFSKALTESKETLDKLTLKDDKLSGELKILLDENTFVSFDKLKEIEVIIKGG